MLTIILNELKDSNKKMEKRFCQIENELKNLQDSSQSFDRSKKKLEPPSSDVRVGLL